jgi:hypothetical protein
MGVRGLCVRLLPCCVSLGGFVFGSLSMRGSFGTQLNISTQGFWLGSFCEKSQTNSRGWEQNSCVDLLEAPRGRKMRAGDRELA